MADLTRECELSHAWGRCQLYAFDEARVAVLAGVGPDAPLADVAMEAERALDVRFFGTSWRLVLAGDDPELVVFGGYDGRGRLRDPERMAAPPAMGWIAEAVR